MADTSNQTGGGDILARLKGIFRTDVGVALGIVAILAVLILPMPTFLLDFALALSITFSVLILMVVMFINRPLDFNVFPTVLLIATMLRLSLNMASTRLILSEGHTGTNAAGDVIEAFGSFMASGNYVIGVIIFSILVIVNFIVITKGAGRIAEVGARFTLDAMPGKQMAIDADLSTGLIDENEARQRRKDLEGESQFYGAMDGASKFVKGDAIAGLLITFINVIGGMIIGIGQQDMPFTEAAQTYTVLTIGDGLVSQIPALVVSTAAGMLVSKTGQDQTTDKALVGQLGGYPFALALASFLMLIFALLPGLPMLPFMVLALATGAAAYFSFQKQENQKQQAAMADSEPIETGPPPEEPISTALHIDLVRLELGYGLLPLINSTDGQRLTDQIKALRRQLAGEAGFIMPSVRIQDNLQLPPNSYVIRIKEVESGRGDIRPNMLLVMNPSGGDVDIPGETTTEPTFGLPATWIQKESREEALFRGFTVVDPPTVITTHITEIVRDNMSELLSYSETQKLLDEMPPAHQKLVADVVPTQITIGGLQRVLQNLLGERLSIRDLPTILEGVAEAASYTRNITLITEHVRTRLARQISEQNTSELGYIPLVTLSPQWEQAFAESIVGDGEEKQLSMAPSALQEFIAKVRETFDQIAMTGETPVMLTSPAIRPYVRSIVERFRPMTMVMSQNEIHPKAKLKTLGQI